MTDICVFVSPVQVRSVLTLKSLSSLSAVRCEAKNSAGRRARDLRILSTCTYKYCNTTTVLDYTTDLWILSTCTYKYCNTMAVLYYNAGLWICLQLSCLRLLYWHQFWFWSSLLSSSSSFSSSSGEKLVLSVVLLNYVYLVAMTTWDSFISLSSPLLETSLWSSLEGHWVGESWRTAVHLPRPHATALQLHLGSTTRQHSNR